MAQLKEPPVDDLPPLNMKTKKYLWRIYEIMPDDFWTNSRPFHHETLLDPIEDPAEYFVREVDQTKYKVHDMLDLPKDYITQMKTPEEDIDNISSNFETLRKLKNHVKQSWKNLLLNNEKKTTAYENETVDAYDLGIPQASKLMEELDEMEDEIENEFQNKQCNSVKNSESYIDLLNNFEEKCSNFYKTLADDYTYVKERNASPDASHNTFTSTVSPGFDLDYDL